MGRGWDCGARLRLVTDLKTARSAPLQGPASVAALRLPTPTACLSAGLAQPALIYLFIAKKLASSEARGGWPPVVGTLLTGDDTKTQDASLTRRTEQYLVELLIHARFLCSGRERGVAAGEKPLERSPRLRVAQGLG